ENLQDQALGYKQSRECDHERRDPDERDHRPLNQSDQETDRDRKPECDPIGRSISPISSTKTTPTAITVTPAICPIRFWKLTALKKMLDFEVKKSVIAMIPMITGRLPTSPDLIASHRARRI